MAITHERLRIVSTESDRTDHYEQVGVVASPDWSLGLRPTASAGANTLLHSLLGIQRERTLAGRLDRLVEAAAGLLQRTDVAVAVPDELGETLEVVAVIGRLSAPTGGSATVLDRLIRAVVRSGQSRLLGDVRLDPPMQQDTAATGVEARSWLGVPLTGPTGAFGALVVADSMPHAFGPDDEQALTALADLASAALVDARPRRPGQRHPDSSDEHEHDGVTTETAAVLATRRRQLETVADLSQFALAADDLDDVLNAAAMVIAGVFDADCSQLLWSRPDGSMLLIEAGRALPDGLVINRTPSFGRASQYGYVLAADEPVFVTDLAHEDRFQPMPVLLDRGMVSGLLVPISRHGRSCGLLGIHANRTIQFADEDVQFLRSVANILLTAVDAAHARHLTEALIDYAPDPIVRYDSELRLLSGNVALGVSIGRPVAELFGQTIQALSASPSPQVDNMETIARSVLRRGREREAELSWATPSGQRDFQMRFVPELGADSQVESLLVIARDVTDRKRLHDEQAALYEELLERDLRLRELIGDLRVEHREERAQDRRLADATFIASQMTAREVEILGMVVAGLTNQQIAARLHLSPGTVRNRLGLLFPKLDVVNRAQAAARAVELGLVASGGA